MSAYQTFLPDCKCGQGNGILFKDNIPCCRWCRKPYAKAAMINYEDEHFKITKPTEESKEAFTWTDELVQECIRYAMRVSPTTEDVSRWVHIQDFKQSKQPPIKEDNKGECIRCAGCGDSPNIINCRDEFCNVYVKQFSGKSIWEFKGKQGEVFSTMNKTKYSKEDRIKVRLERQTHRDPRIKPFEVIIFPTHGISEWQLPLIKSAIESVLNNEVFDIVRLNYQLDKINAMGDAFEAGRKILEMSGDKKGSWVAKMFFPSFT